MSETYVNITDAETYDLPTPTRTGYTFDGWYLGETEIENGDPVTITESCTLTAHWTANTYYIYYDANGGLGTVAFRQLCTYDQDVVLDDPELLMLGYTFAGWSRSATASRAQYAAGGTVRNLTPVNGASITLYAVWQSGIDVPIVPNPPEVELMTLSLEEEPFPTKTETISYTYDAAGNRSQMTVSGAENYTTAYTYDANNRLLTEAKTESGEVTTTSYTYDANGNTLTISTPANGENEAVTKTYTYNRFNQQVSVLTNDIPTAQYTYNAQGIRTTKAVGTEQTVFLLDGGNVVAEIQGDTTTSYLRGVNLISKTADATEYYLFNAHGDVVNLTGSTGVVTKTYNYDAFGNERDPDEADENPFRYCGEYYDTEAGIYYLRARYYDPAIGRFTQQDTHWNTSNMIYGDNPQKINEREDKLGLKSYSYAPQITAIMQAGNLYVYCGNNPIYFHDPTGNAWYHWVLGGAIVVAAAVAVVVTAGGALPAMYAVSAVACGASAGTVASSIAAGAFVSATVFYLGSLLSANYNSIEDFNASANWLTVAFTAGGILVGSANGYSLYTNNRITIAGKGSTGRTEAANLNEQLAMKQVISNPLGGDVINLSQKGIVLNDPRWSAADGWVKMQNTVTLSDGTKIVIHFVYNTITHVFDDFKFK